MYGPGYVEYGYHDLTRFAWDEGVHKAPVGYGDPWLVVMDGRTVGAPSRDRAREIWRRYRQSGDPLYATA